MNACFGKDRVKKNGIYFESTVLDVPLHGWGLRRHQLLKQVEKATRSLVISACLGGYSELWLFRRTPESLAMNTSQVLSPRPASPDTSPGSPLSSGSGVKKKSSPAAPAAAETATDKSDSESASADDAPKSKKTSGSSPGAAAATATKTKKKKTKA